MSRNNNIRTFFNNFSLTYNQKAFYDSPGLNYLNHLEIDFIKNSTKSLKIVDLLEIGFGAGRNLSLFKGRNINLNGIDISEKMLKVATGNLKGEKLTLKTLDAEKGLPYKDGVFDFVMCIRVLKYMNKWRFVISEISRVLKKDGIAILEIPNKFSIHFLFNRKDFI